MKTSAAIRRAQKHYQCGGGPDHACNALINAGDIYFAFTIHTPVAHKARRYCIECAYRYHPDLMKAAMKEIKSDAKQKAARERVGRIPFVVGQAARFKRKLTAPEQFFWEQLGSAGLGVKFSKQQVVHGYVLDFWAPQVRLAVELDGVRHLSRKAEDSKRDEALRARGIVVLRFPAQLVFSDLKFIFDRIREELARTDRLGKSVHRRDGGGEKEE